MVLLKKKKDKEHKETSLFFLVVIIVLFVLGCQHSKEKFTKAKWDKKLDFVYPHRMNMVDDLIETRLTQGICFDAISTLLGKPVKLNNKKFDKSLLYYELSTDYGWNVDPVSVTYLEIEINQDSCLIKCDIVEF